MLVTNIDAKNNPLIGNLVAVFVQCLEDKPGLFTCVPQWPILQSSSAPEIIFTGGYLYYQQPGGERYRVGERVNTTVPWKNGDLFGVFCLPDQIYEMCNRINEASEAYYMRR